MSISDISDIYSEGCFPGFPGVARAPKGAAPLDSIGVTVGICALQATSNFLTVAHDEPRRDHCGTTRRAGKRVQQCNRFDRALASCELAVALRFGRVLSSLPVGWPEQGGEHNTDTVKTTAFGGVGTLQQFRDGCGRSGRSRTSIFESDARSLELQRSMLTAMLRPFNSAKVVMCANSFANASSFASASCTFPYTSQLE
jgi:hypothetical protein